jgi:hypothetical protein
MVAIELDLGPKKKLDAQYKFSELLYKLNNIPIVAMIDVFASRSDEK